MRQGGMMDWTACNHSLFLVFANVAAEDILEMMTGWNVDDKIEFAKKMLEGIPAEKLIELIASVTGE